jgi:hypothetical protein
MGTQQTENFGDPFSRLTEHLVKAQDDQHQFDVATRALLDTAIDQSEVLLIQTNFDDGKPSEYRDLAYETVVIGLDKAIPTELKGLFFDSAKKQLQEVRRTRPIDDQTAQTRRRYQNLSRALLSRLEEGDDFLEIRHPTPVRVDYINAEESEPEPGMPEIEDPIRPLEFRHRLEVEAKTVIEKFIAQAEETEKVILSFASESLSELRTSLVGQKAKQLEAILEQMEAGNFNRVHAMAEDFRGLVRQRIAEVQDLYVLRVARVHIKNGDHEKAVAITTAYSSGADAEITDITNSLVLRDAYRLMENGKDEEALRLIDNHATDGARIDMVKALLPTALRQAKKALNDGLEEVARDILNSFFANSLEITKSLEALSLDSE